MLKYVQSELVVDLVVNSEKDPKAACKLCGKLFKTGLRSSVQRHYTEQHNYSFQAERGVKRFSESQSAPEVCGKIQKVDKNMKSCFVSKEDYIGNCVELMIKNNLSFEFFDSAPARRILDHFDQLYNTSSSGKAMREHISEMRASLSNEIKDKLSGRLFSIKFDIVSRQRRSFLAISVQYAEEFQIKILNLGIVEMKETAKAGNVRNIILRVLGDHGLRLEQIYSSTTDNGGNCSKASRDLFTYALCEANNDGGSSDAECEATEDDQKEENALLRTLKEMDLKYKPVPCAAHTVHLAVFDGLKEFADQIEEIRNHATAIRNRIISKRLNIPLPPRPNTTRWSSTLTMLDGLLRIKASVIGDIPDQLWTLMDQMANALKPFYVLTTKMQALHYTVGDLIRDMCACVGALARLKDPVAGKLLEALRKRQKLIVANPQFAAAIYMDPRLTNKTRSYLTPEEKLTAINFLVASNERMQKSKHRVDSEDEEMDTEVVTVSGSDGSPTPCPAWFETCEFPNEVSAPLTTKSVPSQLPIRRRLEALQRIPMPIAEMDALRHWGFLAAADPELAELAAVVLSVPASQVSVERAINFLPQMMTAFRSKMTDNLQNFLFLKLNLETIK